MKTIEALQQDVLSFYKELEERKNAESSRDISDGGISEISSRAKRYPITNHPLGNSDDHVQERYLLLLLSVADIDRNAFDKSLYTVCRIAHGMNYQGDIGELLLKARLMNFETIDECTNLFKDNELKIILVMECMLVSAYFVDGKRKAMEYIADLGCLLCLKKTDLELTANFARAVIKKDPKEYRCELKNDFDCLDCYIDYLYPGKDAMNIQVFKVEFPYVENFRTKSGNHWYHYLYSIITSCDSHTIYAKGQYKIVIYDYEAQIVNKYDKMGVVFYLNENPQDDVISLSDNHTNPINWDKEDKFRDNIEKHKYEKTNIPFAFAADSLLLYNRAKKEFIAQGGEIMENMVRV